MLTLHCQCDFSLLIIYWGEWEVRHTCQSYCLSRLCKLRLEADQGTQFTNFPLAVWTFWIIIYLLPFCFVSFPLSPSIYFYFVKFQSCEEWMHAFCCYMIEVEEQPPESLNCQQEGFQCSKLWTLELCFPQQSRNIIHLKLATSTHVGKWIIFLLSCTKENRGPTEVVGCFFGGFCFVLFGVFVVVVFFTGWTSKWCRKLDYRFLDSLISWLICWTFWISLLKSLLIFFSLSPLISVRQFLHCNLTTGSCSISLSVPLAILYPHIMVTSWDSGLLGNHAGPFEYYKGSSLAFSAFWQKPGLPRYIFLHSAKKQLADM